MSMTKDPLAESASSMAESLQSLSDQAALLAADIGRAGFGAPQGGQDFLVTGLTIFVLACFVGYYVVWRVTPALHSPLMGITNAISSVIIVGAVIAAGAAQADGLSVLLAFVAVMLASVNIFGGFIITRRMLHMFKKKG